MRLLVLGMHRSGTSAVAGILKIMGAYFGPESVSIGASAENPKGFFERRDVRELNDAILRACDADWNRLATFRDEAVEGLFPEEFDKRAQEIVTDLDAHQPWFLKEPRFCLLMGFWRRHIPQPVLVHVVRDPVEVAMSLHARNSLPIPYGIAMWERYTRCSLKYSRGSQSVLVRYSDLLKDSCAELGRLHSALSRLGVALRLPSREEIGEFVDFGLHRQRSGSLAFAEYLNAKQAALYQQLLDGDPELPASAEEMSRGGMAEIVATESFRFSEANAAQEQTSLQKDLRHAQRFLRKANCARRLKERELKVSQRQLARLKSHFTRALRLLDQFDSDLGGMLKSWRWVAGNLLTLRIGAVKAHRRIGRWNDLHGRIEQLRGAEDVLSSLPDRQFSKDPQPSIAIVICVHNALGDVRACLDSIQARTLLRHSLILVNDGSDAETTAYLRSFARSHSDCQIIENPVAAGYTKAANQGMRAANSDYVILLNSDTIVSEDWLGRLLAPAEADPKVGIVSPLSNAASWQSVPELTGADGKWSLNPLPDAFGVDDMARLVSLSSKLEFPKAELLNGFCLAVKRSVFEKAGYFDEQNFPQGYGEENDFCLRAVDVGFSLAIADHCYVYHAKSKSFGSKRRAVLVKAGAEALSRKHGDDRMKKAMDQLKRSPVLKGLRDRIKSGLEHRPRVAGYECKAMLSVLFLLPCNGAGGGIYSVVQEAQGMREAGVFSQIAIRKQDEQEYRKRFPAYAHDLFWTIPNESMLIGYAAGFDTVVATIFTSVRILEEVVSLHPSVLPAYYIQDYEPWFFDRGSREEVEAATSYEIVPNMLCFAKTDWLCKTVGELHEIEVQKVKASVDHATYYPPATPRPESPVTICAMVRPATPRRGAASTVNILNSAAEKFGDAVRIVVFGVEPNDADWLALEPHPRIENLGVLSREEVADALRHSHIFADFSTYQAFGRTGIEAMACGCATILPSKGGVYEYAVDESNALIVATSSLKEMDTAVVRLITDATLRQRLAEAGLATAARFTISSAVESEIGVLVKALRERSPAGKRRWVPVADLSPAVEPKMIEPRGEANALAPQKAGA